MANEIAGLTHDTSLTATETMKPASRPTVSDLSPYVISCAAVHATSPTRGVWDAKP